jgi:hypothetical protein
MSKNGYKAGLASEHDVDTDSNANLNDAFNRTNYGTTFENFDSNYTNFTTNSSSEFVLEIVYQILQLTQ